MKIYQRTCFELIICVQNVGFFCCGMKADSKRYLWAAFSNSQMHFCQYWGNEAKRRRSPRWSFHHSFRFIHILFPVGTSYILVESFNLFQLLWLSVMADVVSWAITYSLGFDSTRKSFPAVERFFAFVDKLTFWLFADCFAEWICSTLFDAGNKV